ncbi:MAG TPA: Asp-tRNA(Asn)/Glu-tRNA(Gln) amidotransferase subunit GatB, partial [Acidimicrobiales bacterium]|nr:Asp-tRNA(Asn)/Glu-tRNA(Gln) amidotransferase subunit GatB [Acidimicrobiales bacterium]
SEDYRYFQEPDLVPVAPGDDWLSRVAASLPPLPAQRRDRLAEAAPAVSSSDIALVVELGLDDLVVAAVTAGADPRIAVNRAANEVAAAIADAGRIDPEGFGRLVKMESGGQLTATQSKAVLGEMLRDGGDPESIARAHGFEAMGSDALSAAIDDVIAANPAEWEKFVGGDQKVMGALIGKVMAATDRKANGADVTTELRRRAGR